ncbi:2-oxoacid:ferredoxin oxidoreductase subunit beta [candidate division KSB1 bacterium]|nr:MAG: 2-oxoacid:ferredoxin oxidoreductase subunit beta [candidate division KSB1 bacterium]
MMQTQKEHPIAPFLRMDRIPHIWCPTCGIGTTVKCFCSALSNLKIDLKNVAIVSGIGCTGRVAGYINIDSFHTTHGRAIPFATGLKLANPKLKVIVFSGDGDLIAIGGNHFIHAARRNMDLIIICVNNFIYGMTGGQVAPTTPLTANTSTTPYGNNEKPFNIPHLAASCGATYVARWTALHIRRLTRSMEEVLQRKGFSVIEIVTPCATLYARRNRLGDGLNLMQFYHDNSEIKHGADTKDIDIEFQKKIVVGKFIDEDKPTFLDLINEGLSRKLGEKFIKYA